MELLEGMMSHRGFMKERIVRKLSGQERRNGVFTDVKYNQLKTLKVNIGKMGYQILYTKEMFDFMNSRLARNLSSSKDCRMKGVRYFHV